MRRRFDPRPGENFNPGDFLADHGTLYLLAQADDPASRLLQCLVADITCTARTSRTTRPGHGSTRR